jgi:hypothetical protein
MTRNSRGRRRTGLIVGSLALISLPAPAACSSPPAPISIGMTKSEVRARLGAPERIAVLDGKVIHTIAPDAEARVRGRVVYFYHQGRLAVWFERTRVTGVTDTAKSGIPDRQAEDH